MRRGFDPDEKPKGLTFEQQVAAAWAYFTQGVDQATLAGIHGVNQGRIAEVCKAVREALAPKKDPDDAQD